jgi:myosin I
MASRPTPATPVANGMNGLASRPAGSKPTPPAPPAKRPVGKKPAAATPSGDESRPDSMAGSLAEALRQRQAAMSSRKKDDDW